MNDARKAWDQVADHMEALGLKLKLHLEEAQSESCPQRVTQMLVQLGASVDHALAGASDAIRDSAVRDDLRQAADSLQRALVATVDQIRHDIDRVKQTAEAHRSAGAS